MKARTKPEESRQEFGGDGGRNSFRLDKGVQMEKQLQGRKKLKAAGGKATSEIHAGDGKRQTAAASGFVPERVEKLG